MTYLIDTSVWITYFSRSHQQSVQHVKSRVRELLTREMVYVCGTVIAECIQGFLREEERQYIETLFSFPFLETTREIFEHAGWMNRDLLIRGQGLVLTDCLIAATALVHDCTLVTADRHFERFPDLKLLLL